MMHARYLLSAAATCLLLTSGLAYAQTPAETKKDEPRKEHVEKDQQPAKGGENRSEARPQERTRERGETGGPRQAGEERAKPLNAAEQNGAANPEGQKGARRGSEAAKPNEHADESRHEGAAQSAHENRDERTKSSAAPKTEKPAAEKSAAEKSTEEGRTSKSGSAANENSQTQRDGAAKGSAAASQQSSPRDNKGAAANETDKAKGSNEAQRSSTNGVPPTNEAQRGATNAAQPNSAAASSQLPRDKEVRISETLKRHELAPPERNLNISISVGAEIPDRVRVHRLPPEIVSITPEYRDYDYFTTDDSIVIVEPRSHRIVSQVPRDVSRSRAENEGGAATPPTATNLAAGGAAPCLIQKRDASGQLTEVAPTTVGSAAQGRNSIAVIVQTPDQRSSSPIGLDVPAGQIIVATQGPGDCRVTIEPEPAR